MRRRRQPPETAPIAEAGAETVLADVGMAGQAHLARAFALAEGDDHPIAGLEALDLGPDLLDDAAELMAEHMGELELEAGPWTSVTSCS